MDGDGREALALVDLEPALGGVGLLVARVELLQLGLLGVAVLYAMWAAHLRLFVRLGPSGAIGLVLVAQSILSSLFNSSLFDLTHGWVYVWGVGVLAGMAARESRDDAPAHPAGRRPLTAPARS